MFCSKPNTQALPSFNELITSIPLTQELHPATPESIASPQQYYSPIRSSSPKIMYAKQPNYNYQYSPVYTVPNTLPNTISIPNTAPIVAINTAVPVNNPAMPIMTPGYSYNSLASPSYSPMSPMIKLKDIKRKHVCKICSRSFTTSGHLARHNRIHTGERKHCCPWPTCDARFARQDNCMQHYKTHTNGKTKRSKLNFKSRCRSVC